MSMILKSYGEYQLEPNVSISTTSWLYKQTTNATLTVTLGENQKPYNGTAQIQYTNGISGPATIQVTNGNGTIPIARTSTADATITIVIPQSATTTGTTVRYTGTVSGQNLYDAAGTYWYASHTESFFETGDAGGVSSTNRYGLSIRLENSIIYSGSSRNDYNKTSIAINGITYYRGDLMDTDHETVDGGSSNNYTRYRRYYYAIRRA